VTWNLIGNDCCVVVRNGTTLSKAHGSTSTTASAFINCWQKNCAQLCPEQNWTLHCVHMDYRSPVDSRRPWISADNSACTR